MTIEKFHDDRYEVARPITPYFPTGDRADDITLYVKSTGCAAAEKHIHNINAQLKLTGQVAWDTGQFVFDWDKRRKYDIDLACALLDGFTGVVEYDKELVYNEENKRRLMTEYDWLRRQVLEEAQKQGEYEVQGTKH